MTTTLPEAQAVVARLYVDAAWRRRFAADPVGFLTSHAPNARDAVGDLDVARLEHFARSLLSKRLRESRRLLPFTAQALGSEYASEFLAYASQAVPGGPRKPLADAMAFAAHAKATRSFKSNARDAARFDWLYLNMHFRLRRRGNVPVTCVSTRRKYLWVRLACFDYCFPSVPCDPDPVRLPARRHTIVLFANVFGFAGVWYW